MESKNTWRGFAVAIGIALAFGVAVGVVTFLLGVDLGFFGYVIAFVVAYAVWEGVKYLRKKRHEDQGPPNE